jgi:hypothetical protein
VHNHQNEKVHASQYPIDQPYYVNTMPAGHSPIYPIAGIPQPNQYITNLDPVFIQHLSRHQGQRIAVMTTVGRIEGVIAGVGVDHIQINLEDRSLHIRV